MVYFGRRRLKFEETEKEVALIKGSHLVVKLEHVGKRRRKSIKEQLMRGGDLVKNNCGEPTNVKNG